MSLRSLQKTSRKLAKNLTTLKEWSSKHCWVERSATYDAEQAEVERLAAAQAILERARLREQRRDELCESLWHKAKAIEKKLDEMLRFPGALKADAAKSRWHRYDNFMPAKWDFDVAARMAVTLRDLSAFSVGMPSTITEHQGKDGAELPVPDGALVIPPVVIRIIHTTKDGTPITPPAPGQPPAPLPVSAPVKTSRANPAAFTFERSR